MKLLCGLFLIIFASSAFAEEIPEFLRYKEGDRYFLAPTKDGKALQVVDLEEKEIDNRFDAETDVFFKLFTRSNPTSAQIVAYGDDLGLSESNYAHDKPTKVVSHGWNSDTSDDCRLIRDSFLNNMDVNVICVDWGVGAGALYPTAVNNVALTGRFVAKYIDWLISNGSPVGNFHIMGHSLGGHVTGIAARSVESGKIPYITGWDPAFPLWGANSQRIRPSDADYVEIIHTNSGNLGLEEPVGHNDFYPNGGKNMPGCSVINVGCSHGKSVAYFAYSLDHTGFMADECADYSEIENGSCSNLSRLHMGGASPKPARGIFALKTGDEPPYYLG